ncbi:MAG: hypothetical protein ACREQJ_02025, partial [Candidatus Binatia bacterium]
MIRREPHQSRKIPFRVGLVLDEPASAEARREVREALELCFSDATEAKRLDRPVELVVSEVTGGGAALAAWRDLVAAGAEIVLGPHGDEAALAVAEAMRTTPRPTISACETSRFSSDFGVTLGPRDAARDARLAARELGVELAEERVPGAADEPNPTALAFFARFGRTPTHAGDVLIARDAAEIVIQALATAKPHNAEGIRLALDRIRFVPAAFGPADALISIGPFDHRAYKIYKIGDVAPLLPLS